ncbi:phosphoribosylformylglycinamidine synthase [Apiospora arundinis]
MRIPWNRKNSEHSSPDDDLTNSQTEIGKSWGPPAPDLSDPTSAPRLLSVRDRQSQEHLLLINRTLTRVAAGRLLMSQRLRGERLAIQALRRQRLGKYLMPAPADDDSKTREAMDCFQDGYTPLGPFERD